MNKCELFGYWALITAFNKAHESYLEAYGISEEYNADIKTFSQDLEMIRRDINTLEGYLKIIRPGSQELSAQTASTNIDWQQEKVQANDHLLNHFLDIEAIKAQATAPELLEIATRAQNLISLDHENQIALTEQNLGQVEQAVSNLSGMNEKIQTTLQTLYAKKNKVVSFIAGLNENLQRLQSVMQKCQGIMVFNFDQARLCLTRFDGEEPTCQCCHNRTWRDEIPALQEKINTCLT